MLRNAELDTLVKGQFSLSSLRIELSRVGTGSVEFAGPGEIIQSADGGLSLRLFDAVTTYKQPPLWVAGELIPDADYYTMNAVSVDGTVWTAADILPGATWANGGTGCVVTAELNEIVSTDAAVMPTISSRLTVVFPTPLALPANTQSTTTKASGAKTSKAFALDTAEFEAADMSFHCTVEPDRTRVSITAKKLPDRIDLGLIGALQFLLGREVRYVYSYRSENGVETTTVRSTNRVSPTSGSFAIEPPLTLNFPHSGDAWKLFGCYLDFALAVSGEEFDRISTEWESVIRASGTGLEGQALVWSVAVEAILKAVDPHGAKLPPTLTGEDKEVANWVEKARGSIVAQGCPAAILSRFDGFFRQLTIMSPAARLKRLATVGEISEDTIKSWNLLRNTRAHGSQGKLKSPSEVLAARDAVLTLLYQLVFHGIRYSGKATAYNRPGWPDYTYPTEIKP